MVGQKKMTLSDVSVLIRRRGSKKTYYYCIRNPETGKFSDSKKSVLKLAKDIGLEVDGRINRNDAMYIVAEAIRKGALHFPAQSDELNPDQLLIPYVERICDEKSPLEQAETKRKGRPHSKRYLDKMNGGFRNHAKPLIPVDMTLRDFTKPFANKLRDMMYENGSSPDSINAAMKALKTAFNYAELTGLVEYNPMDDVKKFVVNRREKSLVTFRSYQSS